MTTSYLNRFRSGLRAVQSKQILALLNREKERGNITSVEEFKERLKQLTSKLSSTHLSSTLEIFLAEVEDIIDSDSYNFMLERIEDDLTAAFEEINDIDKVLNAHETIINDVVLKNIELAIDELESRIESYEFINTTRLGFDNAVFNTFRITQNNRSGPSREVVFIDPKTGISNNAQGEAFVDFIGEKLLLRTSLAQEIPIHDIRQIYDYEATGTELDVQFDGSNIRNVIDNRVGTFWVQSTLLSQPRGEAGVITKIELDLGTFRTINTLELEPVSLYPIELAGIDYLNSNNEVKSILTNPIEIRSTNKLLFNAVATNKLILKFRNRNYSTIQFQQKPNAIEIIRNSAEYEEVVSNVSDALLEIISSPRLQQSLQLPSVATQESSFIEYLIGFDNIRVGLNKFSEISVFVSASQRVDKLGQLALRVNEKRPYLTSNNVIEYTTDTYPLSKDRLFYGSLEYYCIKQDYSSTDVLLNSTVFPVLPLGASQIRHERLYLTEKSDTGEPTNDVGYLQFFTIDSLNDITVYRNGIPLPQGDLDVTVTDGWLKHNPGYQPYPNQNKPMRFAIKIQKPDPNHIYTVSYKPAVSTADYISPENSETSFDTLQGLKYVDLTGKLDAWLGKDNIIRFRATKNGTEIAYSIVNLVVVLRRNSANVNLTPVLEDYLIATGTINEEKFKQV